MGGLGTNLVSQHLKHVWGNLFQHDVAVEDQQLIRTQQSHRQHIFFKQYTEYTEILSTKKHIMLCFL